MTVPRPRRQQSSVDVAVRVIGGTIGVAALVLSLLGAYAAVMARVSFDPHGYGVIFGTMLAVTMGSVCVIALPAAFPAGRRILAYTIAVVIFLVAMALLFAALKWLPPGPLCAPPATTCPRAP